MRDLFRRARMKFDGHFLSGLFSWSVTRLFPWRWTRRFVHSMDSLTRHGIRLHLDHEAMTDPLTRKVFDYSYESSERWFVSRYLPRDIDVVELGTGIGFVACYIANHIHDDRTMVTLEANDGLTDIVEMNRETNGVDFELVNAAYHPSEKSVSFQVRDVVTGSSTYHEGRTVTVEAVSLADLTTMRDIDTFALICDVEGSEVDLVRSELEFVERHCPLFIVETHTVYDGAVEEVRTSLADSDFELVETHGSVHVYRNRAFDGR